MSKTKETTEEVPQKEEVPTKKVATFYPRE
jgi:hypothetical protein